MGMTRLTEVKQFKWPVEQKVLGLPSCVVVGIIHGLVVLNRKIKYCREK